MHRYRQSSKVEARFHRPVRRAAARGYRAASKPTMRPPTAASAIDFHGFS